MTHDGGVEQQLTRPRRLRAPKASFRHAALLVAGDGSEAAAAQAYATREAIADVEFLGYVPGPAKREAFLRSHVYLFPSWHGEGMPNSLLEAMACGLAVVTRPVGGVPDVCLDGAMGRLIHTAEPEELAQAVGALGGEPERLATIAAGNQSFARERFLATRVAAHLEAIYQATATGGAVASFEPGYSSAAAPSHPVP